MLKIVLAFAAATIPAAAFAATSGQAAPTSPISGAAESASAAICKIFPHPGCPKI